MVSYEVNITDRAAEQIRQIIHYILYTLYNPQAAAGFLHDFRHTSHQLYFLPGSLRPCRHPVLHRLGYSTTSLKSHRYILICHVENSVIFVDAVYHHLQDYENTFAAEIK